MKARLLVFALAGAMALGGCRAAYILIMNSTEQTHLTAQSAIASGAVDLFLSGVNRTMERGAQMGVHSGSDTRKEAANYPKDAHEHALNRDYIVDMDVPEDFYWFTIYEAPADATAWMSVADIKQYGLLTEPILDANSAGDIPFGDFNDMRDFVLKNG